MTPAIVIEVDVVLVFRPLRQILYPENKETTSHGGKLERSRKPCAIFGIHNETVDSTEYVVLMPSHFPC